MRDRQVVANEIGAPSLRRPYRVVLWGPGYTGQQALREMLRRPEIEVVGCLAYSPDKAGLDIGEMIGAKPTGVRVTTDREAIYALDADIVVYTGRAMPDERPRRAEMESILRSGKDVVTSTAYFFPWQYGESFVHSLEQACIYGDSTLHATGIHPGWFMERYVLTLTALCSEVTGIEASEVTDIGHHAGNAIQGMGIGMQLERLGRKTRKEIVSRYYIEAIAGTAHTLGVSLDRIVGEINYPLAEREWRLPTLTIQPGTVSAVEGKWIGFAEGEPFITIRELWYTDPSLVPEKITSPDSYDVRVHGRPVDLHARIDLEVTAEGDVLGVDDRQCGANLSTAVQVVLTIPAVVDAPAGLFYPTPFAIPTRDLRRTLAPLARRPVPVQYVQL